MWKQLPVLHYFIYLTQDTVRHTTKIVRSVSSPDAGVCRCSWGEWRFPGQGQHLFPSLPSRHCTRRTTCGAPVTTGWWRGRPGPASTHFSGGLGTSQDDKYPFSLSEESMHFEAFGRFVGFIFPAILWPQNFHSIWWREAIKISELKTRNIFAAKNWKGHCMKTSIKLRVMK